MNSLGLIVILSLAWTFFWKGIALWRAANSKQKYWFAFMVLPLNTLGLIELPYLFFFAKKRLTLQEIKSWLRS